MKVLVASARKPTRVLKRLFKRRSAIEPVIGLTKQDHALKRNYLSRNGGRINAFLAGRGFNLRKLLRFFSTTALIQPQTIAL
jgi:IS5 family transposase